jgi:hypothetical protein
LLGVKRPGRGVDHPPASSAKVKEKIELHLYYPLGLLGNLQGELHDRIQNPELNDTLLNDH